MFDPGSAACKKGHDIRDTYDNIDSDRKLLSIAEKGMSNDLCKCTAPCMGDVLTCMKDGKCKALLPKMD